LPEPDSPTIAIDSRSASVSETPSTAVSVPDGVANSTRRSVTRRETAVDSVTDWTP
jgi:hypothetical protein